MTQRIELFFFFEYDSKNRTFFECDSNWNFWLKISQKNSKLIFSHDPKNRTRFFSIWLKELNLFRLDSKIWCYSVWPKELNFFWLGLTELDPFLEYDSENWIFSWVFYMSTFFKNDAENWTLFSLNMTQRIEPFFLWMWRKELNPFFFECDVKNWNFFLEYDAKNWTLFLFEAKKRTFISLIWMTPRIVFSNKKYSMNWTFWNMTQRIEHLNHVSKRRLREWNSFKIFFLKWLIELNLFLNLFKMTQRVEVFFQYDSKNWTLCFSQNVSKNWIFFFKKCSKNWTSLSFELLFYMTQWIELFSIWLEELSLFKYDSKSWTFFFWIWLKNLNLRLSMTQRSDPFWTWLKEVNFFEHYSENRTLFLRRRKELNLFSKSDSKNWNLFSKYDAKNWNFFFFEYDSKNWTFFLIWLKEMKSEKRLKELNLFFFLIWLTELNLFFFHLYDSKNWTLCQKKNTQKIEIFFVDKWLTELNSL